MYTFNVNPVSANCDCSAIQWEVPITTAPSVTVFVGSSYTAATTGYSALALRYSTIVATSVGINATNSRVKQCYTQSSPVDC